MAALNNRWSFLSGLGDMGTTCWIDSKTGAEVCGAGDPTGEVAPPCPSGPYNVPLSKVGAPDGSTWTFQKSDATTISSWGQNGTFWPYSFMYHAGTSDVYQRTGGPVCHKVSCNYIVVAPGGSVSWTNTPPPQQEGVCPNAAATVSNITTATAVQQPATATSPAINTYAVTSSVPVFTGGGTPLYAGSPYSSPYVATPTSNVAPAAQPKGLLSNIPEWALLAGAGVGGLLLAKMMGGRR